VATISSLLADHVTLQVRSVDWLFFQVYVPRLQTQFQVIRFLLDRGFPDPVAGSAGPDRPRVRRRGREFHRRPRSASTDGSPDPAEHAQPNPTRRST
jgi:hypothetical protein